MNSVTITDFINDKYRAFWEYSNKNGKNSVDPREQLPEVIRKIIFASYKINIRPREEHKTTELIGEVAKYHAHGNSSIEDSIKGTATAYKSQPCARILEGIGNFGSCPGDEGAAGRYTSVSGTPLLSAIYKDLPYVPYNSEDTGLDQPEYISLPLPMSLICGQSQIGTGKSCYIAERKGSEVINWIDNLRKNEWDISKEGCNIPRPISVTGCKTWLEPANGYTYYEAIIHKRVDADDISKKGKFDIITALPPKQSADIVINKLKTKLPPRVKDKIMDGSGKGRPVWIIIPTGYLEEDDYAKYNLRTARKEQIYAWDHNKNTMKETTLKTVAKEWFEDRCEVVTKRLQSQIDELNSVIHKIDLIKIYVDEKMTNWLREDIINRFTMLFPETGEEDAKMVLRQPASAFLPESLKLNDIEKKKSEEKIKSIKKNIKNIGDFVINEAKEIIKEQNDFFGINEDELPY